MSTPRKPATARKTPSTKKLTKAERSRKARGARAKGNRYEVEAAHMLEPLYPKARRGKEQTRQSHDAPDVEGTEWWPECKSYKGQFPARKALMQALEATTKNNGAQRRPVVFIRQTKVRPDMAVMRLEDWIELVGRALGAESRVKELEGTVAELELNVLRGLDEP